MPRGIGRDQAARDLAWTRSRKRGGFERCKIQEACRIEVGCREVVRLCDLRRLSARLAVAEALELGFGSAGVHDRSGLAVGGVDRRRQRRNPVPMQNRGVLGVGSVGVPAEQMIVVFAGFPGCVVMADVVVIGHRQRSVAERKDQRHGQKRPPLRSNLAKTTSRHRSDYPWGGFRALLIIQDAKSLVKQALNDCKPAR